MLCPSLGSSAKAPPFPYSFSSSRQSRPLLRRGSPVFARRCQITASSSHRALRVIDDPRESSCEGSAAESGPILRHGGQEPQYRSRDIVPPASLPPSRVAQEILSFFGITAPEYPPPRRPRATSPFPPRPSLSPPLPPLRLLISTSLPGGSFASQAFRSSFCSCNFI
jgi:hypothetical protein